jgi:hypothetical protein
MTATAMIGSGPSRALILVLKLFFNSEDSMQLPSPRFHLFRVPGVLWVTQGKAADLWAERSSKDLSGFKTSCKVLRGVH